MINFLFYFVILTQSVQEPKVDNKNIIFVKKGDVVTYDGYLFKQEFLKEFWIKVVVDSQKKDLELEKEKKKCLIITGAKDEEIKLLIERSKNLSDIIKEKENLIEKLNKNSVVVQSQPFYKKFWFGIVAGATVTSIIFYGVIYIIRK